MITSPTEMAGYCTDWSRQYTAEASAVLLPESAEQVQAILAHCNRRLLPVVPQGGLTGLVGAAVPSSKSLGEVVLNVSKMDKILSIDGTEQTLSAEAGCILESVDRTLGEQGLMMPVDLGAKGSCLLGGLVATNAGGTRFRKYGSLHQNTAGLEVVLPDGQILDLRGTLRKDNTGIDLKHLFIGSEGCLGVITKVDMLCARRPLATALACLQVDSFEKMPSVYERAQALLADDLAAFEFWDAASERLVQRTLGRSLRSSLYRAPAGNRFSVMIEAHGQSDEHAQFRLEELLEDLAMKSLISDALLATDIGHQQAMWAVREGISEACARSGYVLKYDVSLPVRQMYSLVERVRNSYQADVREALGFGHVGDGNLHLNVVVADAQKAKALKPDLDRLVYSHVRQANGSISAEHGIGQLKLDVFEQTVDPIALGLMQKVKAAFDPNRIMNPYKMLPMPEAE